MNRALFVAASLLMAAPAWAQSVQFTPRVESGTLFVDAENPTGQRQYCVTNTQLVGMRAGVTTYLTLTCGGRVEPGLQQAVCRHDNLRLDGAQPTGQITATCRAGTGEEDVKRPGERGHGHETPPPGFAR